MDATSSFPPPPLQLIERYTNENIKNPDNSPYNLLPPPIPQDNYTAFGNLYTIDDQPLPPLESHGIRRLYPKFYNKKFELEKLLKSIVTSYLDLIEILISNPDSYERIEKLEDLNLLFINMSHIINEYRPLQAKYFLKGLLQRQLTQRKNLTFQIKENLKKTKDLLNSMNSLLPTEEAIKHLSLADIEPPKHKNNFKNEIKDTLVINKDDILCKIYGDL